MITSVKTMDLWRGLLVFGITASQVLADKKCFAPVVCNEENGSNEGWLQIFPHPICNTNDMSSVGPKNEVEKDSNVQQIAANLLGMLSATSCSELESKYGVDKTGHYLMRENRTKTPIYIYCDFQIHEGISRCKDLWNRVNPVTGYYRFRDGGSVTPQLTHCIHYVTCAQLQQYNRTWKSGTYMMSPGRDPYRVHCHFSSGSAVTEVRHNTTQEIQADSKCEDAGCYFWIPQYEVNQNSLLKIIENSLECRQHIKMRCQGATHTNKAWWVSRQGYKMLYWGGATSRRDKYCACGETGTCVDRNNTCNCDENSGEIVVQDEGFLTDKTKLPVRELRFGDISGDNSIEIIWHTLGNLECTG